MVQFTGKNVLIIKLFVLLFLIIGGLAATAQSALPEHFIRADKLEKSHNKVAVVDVRNQ